MSLFKTKEWWRTECGVNETFDGQSLLVTTLFNDDVKDVIVVGSHSGYLRIYSPTVQWSEEAKAPSAYRSTDLIVEAKIADSILDVKSGKFVSGSDETRLAVLSPTKLIVLTATLARGTTDSGDRCNLQVAYEHSLARFPASLTVGPFGCARGRDFMCVQTLDGILLFFEQEVYTFTRVLKSRLLPEPIVYVSRNDVFVTLSSGWVLECYRYQNLAEAARKEEKDSTNDKKSFEPDWSYNLGEPILGINSVLISSFEVAHVVLGDRTLYCFGDACNTLKFAKRLEYNALCFLAYVTEPDGKLMVIVIADTSTLMIYEGTTLKWSAQLPFAPVAVARAQFQNLDGAIVILSEDGHLEVCYLGSEPSVFVAPPVHRRVFDYVAAENELMEIRSRYKELSSSGVVETEGIGPELVITPLVSPDLIPSSQVSQSKNKDDTESRPSPMCKLTVELSSYSTLKDLEVFINVSKPLVVSKESVDIPTLCDKFLFKTSIYLEGNCSPISSELTIIASYINDGGNVRVAQKSVNLPLKVMLRSCTPEATASFAVTIKSTEPVVNFSQLFPEFIGEYSSKQITNSLGLQHALAGHVVSISSGLMLNRYRVQSNDGLALPLVVHQLINRLREKTVGNNLTVSIGQSHILLVQNQIEAHFATRLKQKKITNEIALLTTQLRNIEKRMLRGIRERNSRSLAATGLPTLLESTYLGIFKLLEDLAAAQAERERASHCLQCALRLLLLMLQLNVSDDKYAMLESAIGFEPQLRDEVDWEEVTDAALVSLLRLLSRKNVEGDVKMSTFNRFETTKDLAKFKKRFSQAVERISVAGRINNDIKEVKEEYES